MMDNEHAFIPVQEISLDEFREFHQAARKYVLGKLVHKSRLTPSEVVVRNLHPDEDSVSGGLGQFLTPLTFVGTGLIRGWSHVIVGGAMPSAFENYLTSIPTARDVAVTFFGVQDNGGLDAGFVPALFPYRLSGVQFIVGSGAIIDRWDTRPLRTYWQSPMGLQGLSTKSFAFKETESITVQTKYDTGTGATHDTPMRSYVAERYGERLGKKM